MTFRLDPSIFRAYDIRGTVTGDDPQITPELAGHVGLALGTVLPRDFGSERVFVGCDNRPSSGALRAAMIAGIAATGLDVTDIGEVITPTVYFASASHGKAGAGVMITGSHLDVRYNGIKMAYGPLAMAGQQITDLLKLIQGGEFARGRGSVTQDFDMIRRHMATIQTKVQMQRPLTIVLDAGNGLSGTWVPPMLRALGLTVHCLYCESDGTYPNHLPNPEDPEMTRDLEAMVLETGADLGLAFDGDADRAGFIDERGHHIAADRLLALLARDLLQRQPGATVVFDVKVTQTLPELIVEYGGVPLMWKTGHSLMKQKMHEVGSPLGGEVSGHLFTGEDYFGFDDAPLIALKALQIFAASERPVSALFNDIPQLPATPEIVLGAPDDQKFRIVQEIRDELAQHYEVVDIDGVRAKFEHGWGLVRASNTQPAITLRFEAQERAQVAEYIGRYKALLDRYPAVDQSKLLVQLQAFRQPA